MIWSVSPESLSAAISIDLIKLQVPKWDSAIQMNLPEGLPTVRKGETLRSDSLPAGKAFGKAGMLSFQKGLFPWTVKEDKLGADGFGAVHPTLAP